MDDWLNDLCLNEHIHDFLSKEIDFILREN